MVVLFLCLLGIVSADPSLTIRQLLDRVSNDYVTKETDYWPKNVFPPLSWQQQQGIYKSFIHINFHGGFPMPNIRNLISIPDSNGFVTMFIDYFLLEALSLGHPTDIPTDPLDGSVNAILSHQDQNLPPGSPVYNFWIQTDINGTWSASPQNLAIPLREGEDFALLIKKFLVFVGLGEFWNKISIIADAPEMFLSAFEIPSDADDTGCGLALGLKLKNSPFQSTYSTWASKNADLVTTMKFYKMYSWKPFSSNRNENLIDPRTYYWIRGYLDEQAAQKNSGLALITTWFQNFEECQKKSPAVRMPFNSNNVDASVVANALFGITSVILNGGDLSWFDSELQSLYQNSANLLEWILRNNTLSVRPDIVLVYYPPIYDFYWFVARLSFLLNNPPHALPFPLLTKTRDMLQTAMETYGTSQILAKVKICDGSGACWDDFLGNADSPPSYSDRLFSTSVALNALFDTWTRLDSGRRSLKPGTPSNVVSILKRGSTWLDSTVLSGKYPPENVFFSGSMKSPSFSLPFAYPSNFHMWLNGTAASCSTNVTIASDNLTTGMSGYVQPVEYQKLMDSGCFNMKLPSNYPGMNCPDCFFPYWSSPALTYAAAMGALSKYVSVGL